VRLFVAVWPPEDVLDRLAAIERSADVRWTTRAQWHVTLHFLGEVDDGRVPDVVSAVGHAASALTPVRVSLGDRLSRFGRAVAHVEVSGLGPWADAVRGALVAAGLVGAGLEDRPFVGHVTIARAKPRTSVAGLAGIELPPGPSSWVASELALVRSELGPGGSRYSNVAVIAVS
jgi:2'-5' RNA ligase